MDPAGTHLVAVEEGDADQQVELRVGQILGIYYQGYQNLGKTAWPTA